MASDSHRLGLVGQPLAMKPAYYHFGEASRMKYEKPAVQRFGTVREITLGSGPNTPGDATNLYHRS
jgi:hypothetical protein